MSKKMSGLLLAVLFLVMSITPVQAVGLQVEPVRQEVSTTADKTTQLRFQVTNPEKQPVTVQIEQKDVLSLTEKGVPEFKEARESLSTKWRSELAAQTTSGQNLNVLALESFPPQVIFTLPAKTSSVVTLNLHVPSDAPKSLYFGVFFRALPVGEQNSPVGIQTSLGSLVALTRSDLAEKAEVVFKEVHWLPEQERLQLQMALENQGNIHLKVDGQAWLEPGWGNGQPATAKVALNSLGRWVLPQDKLLIDLPQVQQQKWLPQLWWFTTDFHLNGVQQHKRIPVIWLTDQMAITIVLFWAVLILVVLGLSVGLYRFSQRRTQPSHS